MALNRKHLTTILNYIDNSLSKYLQNQNKSSCIQINNWVLIRREQILQGKISYQMHGVEFEHVFLRIPFCCHSNSKCFIWYCEQLPSRCFQFPSV